MNLHHHVVSAQCDQNSSIELVLSRTQIENEKKGELLRHTGKATSPEHVLGGLGLSAHGCATLDEIWLSVGMRSVGTSLP